VIGNPATLGIPTSTTLSSRPAGSLPTTQLGSSVRPELPGAHLRNRRRRRHQPRLHSPDQLSSGAGVHLRSDRLGIYDLAGITTSRCPRTANLSPSGSYLNRHNPAIYYSSIRAQCKSWDVPLGTTASGALKTALSPTKDGLPNYSFVTPNACNDMHSCSTASGDKWLSKWIPIIEKSAAYQSGQLVVFITWDEGHASDDTAGETCYDARPRRHKSLSVMLGGNHRHVALHDSPYECRDVFQPPRPSRHDGTPSRAAATADRLRSDHLTNSFGTVGEAGRARGHRRVHGGSRGGSRVSSTSAGLRYGGAPSLVDGSPGSFN